MAATGGVPSAMAYGLRSGHPTGSTSTKGVNIRAAHGVKFGVA